MGLPVCKVFEEAKEQLKRAGIIDANTDAWYLFEYIFAMSRVDFLMNPQKSVEEEAYQKYQEVINKRCAHIPLQHITGTQEFMGLSFMVNENVLIPRQDTECLVETVLEYANDKTVLDMCTGSGCIIISLDKLANLQSATAVDISEQALEVARQNAKALHANITFIESDLFERITKKYDIIVSNPPYIPTETIDTLMSEVKEHDPILALDGKEDGLFFYQKIIANVGNHLEENGMLFFEIGHDQGEAVAGLMEENGFVGIRIKKDLAGLDRIVYGMKN